MQLQRLPFVSVHLFASLAFCSNAANAKSYPLSGAAGAGRPGNKHASEFGANQFSPSPEGLLTSPRHDRDEWRSRLSFAGVHSDAGTSFSTGAAIGAAAVAEHRPTTAARITFAAAGAAPEADAGAIATRVELAAPADAATTALNLNAFLAPDGALSSTTAPEHQAGSGSLALGVPATPPSGFLQAAAGAPAPAPAPLSWQPPWFAPAPSAPPPRSSPLYWRPLLSRDVASQPRTTRSALAPAVGAPAPAQAAQQAGRCGAQLASGEPSSLGTPAAFCGYCRLCCRCNADQPWPQCEQTVVAVDVHGGSAKSLVFCGTCERDCSECPQLAPAASSAGGATNAIAASAGGSSIACPGGNCCKT